ncbi:uncharacterized protein [Typha angustifolia]|uniref:uncharacterized protein n=1 Tax=Typha angustifolia TaxID=59011 RepID=UPI003C2EE76B
MRTLSCVGISLTLVSSFLLLALMAELYYLFWWKKRRSDQGVEETHASTAKELLHLFCWRKPSSLSSTALNPQQIHSSTNGGDHSSDTQFSSNSSKDLLLKTYGGEESVDAELMRLHSLSGPPRFLFTIKEETKEDLESEDGRSRGGRSRKGSRGRSLSDLLHCAETPFLTPLSSPPLYTPQPLTPMDSYKQHGFNPLFESSREDDFNRVSSSPPPKFKFLKDAEEKLYRKTLLEEAMKAQRNGGLVDEVAKQQASTSPRGTEEEDGSFITIVIGKNRERVNQIHSTSSQVTPLPSSPSKIRAAQEKPI